MEEITIEYALPSGDRKRAKVLYVSTPTSFSSPESLIERLYKEQSDDFKVISRKSVEDVDISGKKPTAIIIDDIWSKELVQHIQRLREEKTPDPYICKVNPNDKLYGKKYRRTLRRKQ